MSTYLENRRKSEKHYVKSFNNECAMAKHWKEHIIMGNGKTLRPRVHMQLKYVMC